MPFIPHTAQDVQAMLECIGAKDIDALFDEIPDTLKSFAMDGVPPGTNEMGLIQHAEALAKKNHATTCFIGAGAYDHHIPSAVWDIASRGEFLTAYTPYQAEASQGTLQLLFEFQTMIAELTGLDVANASLYDGATALAEGVLMAVRLKRKLKHHKVLVPKSIHPHYFATLKTLLAPHNNIEIVSIPFDEQTGKITLSSLAPYENEEDLSALVIPQPNFFGILESVDELSDWAHQHELTKIACVNPISLGLLTPPGTWGEYGVDIACGEGQPLGVPMAYGGPYFGFFSTKQAHVRQMPGRLVGKTQDIDGKTGYTLTLQAREQHIRRAKATSNICTNQGLLVTAATIHMSLLGAEGLRRVALRSHQNTNQLVEALTQLPGVEKVFDAPHFHESLIRMPAAVQKIQEKLHQQGISGGFAVEPYFPELKNTLLVCATEKRTEADILHYTQTLEQVLLECEHE